MPSYFARNPQITLPVPEPDRGEHDITDRERFVRLLLPLEIAYLWLVAVGR